MINVIQIDEIANRYSNGESAPSIAKDFNVTKHAIYRILEKLKVKRRSSHQQAISPDQIDNVVKMYEQGISTEKIGQKYKVSDVTIQNTLERIGIKRRKGGEGKALEFNKSFFKNPLSNEAKYWVGAIWGDGNICKRQGRFRLSFVSTDKDFTEKLKEGLQSHHKITYLPSHNKVMNGKTYACKARYDLCIQSKELVEDLMTHGIQYNKTYEDCIVPSYLEESPDFWRGLVDADGSMGIYNGGRTLALVGTRKAVDSFTTFCRKTLPDVKPNLRLYRNVWHWVICGNNAKTIVGLLYKDAVVFMNRKNKIAQTILATK